ncbi:MAG: hypothetical protein GY810_07540 [Aureispira sp.]|nr:hypothetical protein [Aureispira sp.]
MKIQTCWILGLGMLFLASCSSTRIAFQSDCSTIVFDLKKGMLNNTLPTASQEEVKKAFTCHTGSTEDGERYNCGGGVFFLKNDFFFYTGRDYIEVRAKYTGRFQPDISSISPKNIEEELGKAALKPDENTYFFKRKYGTLRVEFSNGSLSLVAVHYTTPKEVDLCR